MIRGLIALAIALAITSCIVRKLTGPRITGTCAGACDHYIECKSGHLASDRIRCESECPNVFSDSDSLMAYESLSCPNAVEFVDGNSSRAATSQR